MILVVDNYDSFVYNLVQYVGVHDEVCVRRNDAITVGEIRELDPDGIVVSPGPGTPEEAGVSMAMFAELDYLTLGVCLGLQALCAPRARRSDTRRTSSTASPRVSATTVAGSSPTCRTHWSPGATTRSRSSATISRKSSMPAPPPTTSAGS